MQPESTAPIERPQLYRAESKSIFIVILELLFSRWMLIGGIFFAASFWSYVALERAPDTYEATGQVLIRRGNLQAIQDVPIMRQQEEVGSDVDILLSIAVLDETVKQLLEKVEATAAATSDVARQPLIFGTYRSNRPLNGLSVADLPVADAAQLRKWLKQSLRIQKFGESNVLEIALISVSPRFAAEAVNTLIDVYEKFNMRVDRSPGQTAFFDDEIGKIDGDINILQVQLADYKSRHIVVNPEKEGELVALRRHALQIELDKLEEDKAALQTDLNAVAEPATRMHAAFLRNDTPIAKQRENIVYQENLLAELRSRLTADNPQVVSKREQVEDMKHALLQEEELAIAQQKHLFQQVLDKEKELLSKIGDMNRELSAYPSMQIAIDRLDRDIEQKKLKRIDIVEQRNKAATLENADESMNRVRVLGYSQVPPFPREARKGFKFLVALLLSLITSFVVAIFVEGLDHSIRKREEIEEQLHVPYLSSLSTNYRR